MADATRAAFSFGNAAPFLRRRYFTKSDTNGFRTLVDRADDPQARPGTGAAVVLPQPIQGLMRPLSLCRLHEGVTSYACVMSALGLMGAVTTGAAAVDSH